MVESLEFEKVPLPKEIMRMGEYVSCFPPPFSKGEVKQFLAFITKALLIGFVAQLFLEIFLEKFSKVEGPGFMLLTYSDSNACSSSTSRRLMESPIRLSSLLMFMTRAVMTSLILNLPTGVLIFPLLISET